VDVPWYNHHSVQRPLLSSERLPAFSLPQYQGTSSSTGTLSSRVGSLDSSSNPGSSHYNSSQTSSFSYQNGSSRGDIKTPSPTQTSYSLSEQVRDIPTDTSHHSEYPNTQPNTQSHVHTTDPYSNMNQAPSYMDAHQSHMSGGQSYAPQVATAGGMSHYPQYQQQPPVLQPGPGSYAPSPGSYGQYGYTNGVTSPQSAAQSVSAPMGSQVPAQLLPLPGKFDRCYFRNLVLTAFLAAIPAGGPPHSFVNGPGGHGQGYPQQTFDTTGQIAPAGMKPRVTATLWEDEGSLCFQVEAKGVCVARREGTLFRVWL